ncbi:MAG: hypothetical protein LBC02_09310 [Planctomycetaceae bacterium]|jgi:hypothetical protein|nr:hypothetical protein [Planctomycetaceae bacterium]
MSEEIIIANPIYDVVFKRLMDDTEIARFFIETLIGQKVESIKLKPQNTSVPREIDSPSRQLQLSNNTKFVSLDFAVTVKTAAEDSQKILIEIRKGKNSLDLKGFYEYLDEYYQCVDETNDSWYLITIFILGFELKHILTPAVKIAPKYIDLNTKQSFFVKTNIAKQLTHERIIIQIPRIYSSFETELEALLGLFEQNYFVDDNGYFKKYCQLLENKPLSRMVTVLSQIADSEEDRRMLETEKPVR